MGVTRISPNQAINIDKIMINEQEMSELNLLS